MIFFVIIVIALFVSFIAQEFFPQLAWLGDAHIYLLPVVFFYAASLFPFSVMLLLAAFTGFMWDALTAQIVHGNVEIAFGWSMLLYGALGAILNGFRPLFLRGRMEIQIVLSGLFCSAVVLCEFIMISLRRGNLEYDPRLWHYVIGSGVAGWLLAPFVFFGLNLIAHLVGYKIQPANHEQRREYHA